jgi:hypothetical protein
MDRCDCGTCVECNVIFAIYENELQTIVLDEFAEKLQEQNKVLMEALEKVNRELSLSQERYLPKPPMGCISLARQWLCEALKKVKDG